MKGQLFLYHVSLPHTMGLGYDSYSEFVVASTDGEQARWIHPASGHKKGEWTDHEKTRRFNDWIGANEVDELIVTCIGTADTKVLKEDEIIISSYHAG